MRKAISLTGDGRWAVADDGTIWFWDGMRWQGNIRPPLPEPPILNPYQKAKLETKPEPVPMSIEHRARVEKKGGR